MSDVALIAPASPVFISDAFGAINNQPKFVHLEAACYREYVSCGTCAYAAKSYSPFRIIALRVIMRRARQEREGACVAQRQRQTDDPVTLHRHAGADYVAEEDAQRHPVNDHAR